MNLPKVYLASSSPRRSELLSQMGVKFDILRLEVDETVQANESPTDYVQRVAKAKAKAGWQAIGCEKKHPVIGADTSVIVDNDILGKPNNDEQARSMLQRLSARQHQVLTSVAVVYNDHVIYRLCESRVTFSTMTAAEIDWYISTAEGRDKAGSYAVQGLAAMFIEDIQGSYSGIMGLPVRETRELLMEIGQSCYE
jgi:septum formation protein